MRNDKERFGKMGQDEARRGKMGKMSRDEAR